MFQLPPPKRLGTVIKNTFGGAIMPPPPPPCQIGLKNDSLINIIISKSLLMTEINAINIIMLLFINSRLVLRYRNRLTISLVLICRLIVELSVMVSRFRQKLN